MALATRPTFSDPAYQVRLSLALGPVAAGSGGVTTKFVASANWLLFALSTYLVTAGTSTYTNTVGGTGTNFINGQQVSVITITNTATGSGSAALSTSTFGPFIAGGAFASGGTQTGQVGGIATFALNTTAGTSGYGGIPVAANSLVYCVSGTDATAVTNCTLDYQIAPLAGLTL